MDKACSMHWRERNAYKVLVRKLEIKKPPERTRHTREDNTNLYHPDVFHIIRISSWPNPLSPHVMILVNVFFLNSQE
jgi:hypothetical protein